MTDQKTLPPSEYRRMVTLEFLHHSRKLHAAVEEIKNALEEGQEPREIYFKLQGIAHRFEEIKACWQGMCLIHDQFLPPAQ